MPTYTYFCTKCKIKIEQFFFIRDYKEVIECPKCKKKNTHRVYQEDLANIGAFVKKSDSELKTVGDLANRNRDKLSEDERHHLDIKHNTYKDKKPNKDLPKGMKRLKKQPKMKWY
jgi:putative FmdB family regulatory protein